MKHLDFDAAVCITHVFALVVDSQFIGDTALSVSDCQHNGVVGVRVYDCGNGYTVDNCVRVGAERRKRGCLRVAEHLDFAVFIVDIICTFFTVANFHKHGVKLFATVRGAENVAYGGALY